MMPKFFASECPTIEFFILIKHVAKFILKNLENKSLTEQEAGELVSEYVCNPVSADSVRYKPIDGMDWYSII